MSAAGGIVIVRRGGFGDLVMAEPTIRAASRIASGRVALACYPKYFDLYLGCPNVSELIPLEMASWLSPHNPEPTPRLSDWDCEENEFWFLEREFWTVLALQKTIRKATVRTLDYPFGYEVSRGLARTHRSDIYFSVATAGGYHSSRQASELTWLSSSPSEIVRNHVPKVLIVAGGGFNPGCRVELKRWPLKYFVELAQAVLATGAECHFVGFKDDEWIRPGLAGLPPSADWIGCHTLLELGRYMAESTLVVGNDTGLLHFAAAVGARTLWLFGPTDPIECGPDPLREGSLALRSEVECCGPCYLNRPCDSGICITSLTVEAVLSKVMQSLAGPSSPL